MTSHDYEAAFTIGRDAGADALLGAGREYSDRDTFDDAVFPGAFSDAMDALPDVEAPDISGPVHEGIADAWEAYS